MTNKKTTKDEINTVVMINLDRPREVKFGHKSLKMLGAMTNKGVDAMTEDDFDLAELEKVMFCGLLEDAKDHGEDLKLSDMEELLDKAEVFQDIVDAMEKALGNAFRRTIKN